MSHGKGRVCLNTRPFLSVTMRDSDSTPCRTLPGPRQSGPTDTRNGFNGRGGRDEGRDGRSGDRANRFPTLGGRDGYPACRP